MTLHVAGLPPTSTTIHPAGQRSPAPSVRPACTWLSTARPRRPPSADRAEKTTSPSCGTTCPGVCTATTSAPRTRRWRRSAQPSKTGCVGARRASTGPTPSASGTQSAARAPASTPKVSAGLNERLHQRPMFAVDHNASGFRAQGNLSQTKTS